MKPRSAWFAYAALCALGPLIVSDSARAQAQPVPAVVVAPAEVSDLRPTTTFTGRLRATQKVGIRARVSGFLEEVGFVEGERVEQGALLFRIEDEAYQAAVNEVKGNIEAGEAERRLAEIDVERKERLVARDTIAQAELDVSIANLGKADGALSQLRAQLERAELELSYTAITAPFTGTIGLAEVDVGAFVEPSTGVLATLTRLDPMTVEFPVATAQLLRYRANLPEGVTEDQTSPNVSLVLADGSTYATGGVIDFVDAEVAETTDTVIVRAVFDNPDGTLLDGALVGVALQESAPQMVLNVPQSAVQRDQVGDFVLAVDGDSRVELRRVAVVRNTAGRAVIGDGLAEGEVVITEGINKVRPGIVVDAAVASES